MNITETAPPDQTLSPPKPGRQGWNRWIIGTVLIAIVAIGGLFTLIYYTTAQVESQTFSYIPLGLQSGTFVSIIVSDVDGPITITTWTQSGFLINGTLTAKGLGSSLATFKLSNSTDNGILSFKATFPVNPGFFFSQSYTAAVNVFVPVTMRFGSIQVSNTNGAIKIHNLNSTNSNLVTVNGAVTLDCVYCLNTTVTSANGDISLTTDTPLTEGTYDLTSTNSNVALLVPASSSFKAVAKVENGSAGSIQVLNLPGATASEKFLARTFGNGTATVDLSSVNGQITITGT